jgi:hypothetical protein
MLKFLIFFFKYFFTACFLLVFLLVKTRKISYNRNPVKLVLSRRKSELRAERLSVPVIYFDIRAYNNSDLASGEVVSFDIWDAYNNCVEATGRRGITTWLELVPITIGVDFLLSGPPVMTYTRI